MIKPIEITLNNGIEERVFVLPASRVASMREVDGELQDLMQLDKIIARFKDADGGALQAARAINRTVAAVFHAIASRMDPSLTVDLVEEFIPPEMSELQRIIVILIGQIFAPGQVQETLSKIGTGNIAPDSNVSPDEKKSAGE